jgi:hypothetical protein
MSNPQKCFDKLRVLAETGAGDPHKAAAQIVEKFAAGASKADFRLLKTRLEDTLVAGKHTGAPPAYLDQHSRWLRVLEDACAAARDGRRP